MVRRRIIPKLMLHDGELYNSKGFSEFKYIGDPLIAVKIFNEKLAEEIQIIDVDPSRFGAKINFELLKDIAGECFMPLTYSGGVKSIKEAQELFYCGFEKIALNEVAVVNPEMIKTFVSEFGSASIIGSLDFRKTNIGNEIHLKGGSVATGKILENHIDLLESIGIGEFNITCIDHDGSMNGLDNELYLNLQRNTNTPMVFGGGIGNLEHIKESFEMGLQALSCSSLFVYIGPLKAVLINYPPKEIRDSLI